MIVPSESQVAARLSELLAEPLGSRSLKKVRSSSSHSRPDFTLRIGPYRFVIECKNSGATDSVFSAIEQLTRYAKDSRSGLIPLVVVPHMGEVGKRLCKEAGVGWIDLSGNADLVAPGLRVNIEGRPNLFKQSGRPADVFAPKSSRITRYLLTHWCSALSLRGLARETEMDPGFTSRLLKRLEAQGFVWRHDDIIRVRDPDSLLDAWRTEYKFFRHDVRKGHVAARTSEDLLHELAGKFTKARVGYAATGLSAAWLFTHFANFRLVTFYLRKPPEEDFLRELEFLEDSKGANVWLVTPSDEGVFQGELPARESENVQCVHPVQIYLDLKDQPERSAEAAGELRKRVLKW